MKHLFIPEQYDIVEILSGVGAGSYGTVVEVYGEGPNQGFHVEVVDEDGAFLSLEIYSRDQIRWVS